MYRVTLKSRGLEKSFTTYKEAESFFLDTKKNYASQIEEMPEGEERAKLIDMYFDLKIERIPATVNHKKEDLIWLTYPCCWIICDKTKHEDGDLMEVARIMYDSGKITYRENSILPEEVIQQLEKESQRLINHGRVDLDCCGHYLLGGYR